MGFRDALSYVMFAIFDILLGGILMELTAEHLTKEADKLQKEIGGYYWLHLQELRLQKLLSQEKASSSSKTKISANHYHKIKIS